MNLNRKKSVPLQVSIDDIMKMDIRNHKFIILGSYGANALGQIRGLGEKDIKSIAVLVGRNSYRIDKSKYISELYDVGTIEEGLRLVLSKFGNELNRPFLYTDRDDVVALFDVHYEELKDKFFFWNAGHGRKLIRYLNKDAQIALARNCGFLVPQTEMVNVGELPKFLSYPVFTKAINSLNPYWKGNANICHNEEELKLAYTRMDSKQILLQEYIVKQDEMPIEGISINGGEEIILLGKTASHRLMDNTFSTYRYVTPFEDADVEQKTKAFIQEIGFTGPFEIEFILKDNKAYFLEVNFRIAQQNYGYVKLGANIPYIYALSVLQGHIAKEQIDYIPSQKVDIMHEFEDLKASVIHGSIPLFRWIKEFWRTDGLYFFNKNDIRPFYYTILTKCMNAIHR